MKPTVLLLREPDEEYHKASITKDLLPLFIPVLSDQTVNESGLNAQVTDINNMDIWGIVSTSKRASSAFASAFQTILKNSGDKATSVKDYWKHKLFFSPGKASAQPFLDNSFEVKGFESSGDASSLAKFIVQHIESLPAEENKTIKTKKLVFLTGDKTRDELSTALCNANVSIEHLQVYSTFPNPNLIALLEAAQSNVINKFDWVVFFSPSGVDLALPTLKESPNWPSTKIAAIGKTTSSHLESKGIQVHAVPQKPKAELLIDAILACPQK